MSEFVIFGTYSIVGIKGSPKSKTSVLDVNLNPQQVFGDNSVDAVPTIKVITRRGKNKVIVEWDITDLKVVE